MTLPDSVKHMRNTFVLTGVGLLAASFTFAMTARWWTMPVDYWFILMAIATGLGAIGMTIASLVAHCIYLESSHSN